MTNEQLEKSISEQWEKLREFIMDFYRGDADLEEVMLCFKVWARQFHTDTINEIRKEVENMPYNGVLESNDKRRGYDCALGDIKTFLNKLDK